MKRIVVLISGRGSNMQALVRACASEGWPARIVAVIGSRADAPGLEFAARAGIRTAVVDHRNHGTREAFDALYREAWARGLKGITAFRPNRPLGAVLSAAPPRPAPPAPT